MMAPTQLWPMAADADPQPFGQAPGGAGILHSAAARKRAPDDESMAQFVRRRLGRETFDRLVEPLISAVYAADMEKLSVKATLPRFREMETQHGSLIRAMRRQMKQQRGGSQQSAAGESGARYSMFVTLATGLEHACRGDRGPIAG